MSTVMSRSNPEPSSSAGNFSRDSHFAKAIIDNTRDAAFVIQADRRISYVNARAVEILGIDEKKLVGQPVDVIKELDIVSSDDFEKLEDGLEKLFTGEQMTLDTVLSFRTKEIDSVEGHARLSVENGTNGVGYVVGLVRDLSLTEEQREASGPGLPFRTVVDQIPTAVLICTAEEILYVNDRFQEITGHDSSSLVDRANPLDLIHSTDQAEVEQIVRDIITGARVAARFSCRIQTWGGEYSEANMFAARILHEGSSAVNLSIMLADN